MSKESAVMKKSNLVPIFVLKTGHPGGPGRPRATSPIISFQKKTLSLLGMEDNLPLVIDFMEDPNRPSVLIIFFGDEWGHDSYTVTISDHRRRPAFAISSKSIRKALIDKYSIDVPARFPMKKRRTRVLSYEVDFG